MSTVPPLSNFRLKHLFTFGWKDVFDRAGCTISQKLTVEVMVGNQKVSNDGHEINYLQNKELASQKSTLAPFDF